MVRSNSFLKNVSSHAPYNSLFSIFQFATAVATTFHKLKPSILELIMTPISNNYGNISSYDNNSFVCLRVAITLK